MRVICQYECGCDGKRGKEGEGLADDWHVGTVSLWSKEWILLEDRRVLRKHGTYSRQLGNGELGGCRVLIYKQYS